MRVESLIKETVELQGFRVLSVEKVSDSLDALLVADARYSPRCGQCSARARLRDYRQERRFRHVPLWGIDVYLRYTPRRVFCDRCHGFHMEQLPWVAGKRRFTRGWMATLANWAKILTWQQVASLFHCSWGTVAAAVDEVVGFGLEHRDLSDVTHIGVDEISRRRGHVYVTNVYDLRKRILLWSGEGRAKESLHGFFDWFGKERSSRLQGVCCDMWLPYVDVIKRRAPQAVLVFDKFHIVQHLTRAVDQVRRDEISEKGQSLKTLLAKSRYIWLKNPWNLTDHQRTRLSDLEHMNLKINRAYLLKEAFRSFWSYRYAGWATRYLNQWFWWATHSRLPPMRNFAWMLRRHQDDLLNYFRMPIDNGSVEGLNNKAKVISHKAYGFRTAKTYIRNLYHCMADLPRPESVHSFV